MKAMIEDRSVPRLREDLEIMPTSYQGRRAVVVRDALGLIRDPVVIEGDALTLLSLLDGKRTVRDLQLELVRFKRGILVSTESISRMIAEFDAARLLQSRAFQEEKGRLLREYAEMKIRRASHAGVSYPAQPDELRTYLDSIIKDGEIEESIAWNGSVLGLVAPHIDLEIGRKTYGMAYRTIRGLRPKRVFLLGTGHAHSDALLSLTEKDFETPLAVTETDREAVCVLRRAGGTIVAASDIAHRREHSLEFQLIFLQHLLGSEFRLIPVLCGSLSDKLRNVSRPAEIPALRDFLVALRSLWDDDQERALVIAGVDFSHIGPKFGHRETAAGLLALAKSHDHRLIEAISHGDAQAFWAEARRVGDRYNVCGLSTLAILLELFPEVRGRLLDYQIWNEEATQSAVSFAALLLTAGIKEGGSR